MEKEFWIKAWNDGRTAFHQGQFHQKLTEYFPQLVPKQGQTVLVPLCGKTLDMLWLHQQGLSVHGVELHEQAVQAFFTENNLAPVQKTADADFNHYSFENIRISSGDFFKLANDATYDFVYDRAALVALPPEMRKRYAEVIQRVLRPAGKCLLIVYDYDQSKMEGPPFSVSGSEIHSLYQDQFNITLLEEKKPENDGPRLGAVQSMLQKVYVLEKKE